MNRFTLSLFITFIFALSAFLWHASYAQQGVDATLITLEPASPGPNQQVTARLTSFSFDVDRSHLTWTRNGSVVLSGIGAKILRFSTQDVGRTESLHVVARTTDGKEFRAAKEFVIGDFDLLWSAQTTIPPEYRGKALPTTSSLITVSAYPQFFTGGNKIQNGSLIYEWSIDGKREGSASGAGKQTIRFQASLAPRAIHTVALKLSNLQKSINIEKAILIGLTTPEVLLYEERPLEGPHFAEALTKRNIIAGRTIYLRAVPYFFSRDERPQIDYLWSVGNEEVAKDATPNIFEIETIAGNKGSPVITIFIKHLKDVLQRAKATFTLNVQ
ncbi:MAG: hypothetical protein HY445_03555 [Candidatus Niyogibacteria bacterium]|nr:hypothetical protein [Candidatus Niyogibacteria bacterium]